MIFIPRCYHQRCCSTYNQCTNEINHFLIGRKMSTASTDEDSHHSGSMKRGDILEVVEVQDEEEEVEGKQEEVVQNKKMNNFVILKCLGKGAQGSVYQCLSTKDNEEKAMKRILCANLNEANSVLDEGSKKFFLKFFLKL
jgi:serine/threonine protein kinase